MITRTLLLSACALGCGCKTKAPEPQPDRGSTGPASVEPADAATRKAPTEDMVEIPASPTIGLGQVNCTKPSPPPKSTPAFAIDRHLVSCAEFRACLLVGKCPYVGEPCDHDVAVVPFEAAAAYCATRHVQLPSIWEWRRAVMGVEARPFPTGDTLDVAKACQHPTRPPESQILQNLRCENVSTDGVTYFVRDPNQIEWTRDFDCALSPPVDRRLHVGVNLIEALGRTVVREPETADHGEFRCVRDLPKQ